MIKRGKVYENKDQYDRAISDFTKAIEINPRLADGYFLRGSAHAQGKENYDQAINDFNKAIDINPLDNKSYSNRGKAWFFKGDLDRAFADLNKAIEIKYQNSGRRPTKGR